MATGQLRKLNEDNAYYNKVFLFYNTVTDRSARFDRWCQSVFRDDIVAKLNVPIPEGGELRCLGIGSGPGELECHMLKELHEKFPRISNHVVEPSTEFINKYRTYVSANSADFHGIDYQWYGQSVQKYKEEREKASIYTKFHFVSAVHSLYHLDELGKWLDYLYNLLEDGGIFIIVLTADNILTHFPEMGCYQTYTVDTSHVQAHFDKACVPQHNLTISLRTDMTPCFAAEPSVEGELLMDFYSHIIRFSQTADSELIRRFRQRLGSDQYAQRHNGRVFYKDNWGVTFVQK